MTWDWKHQEVIIKQLEKVPYVKLDAVEEVLRTEGVKGKVEPASFVDNTLIAELEKEGLYRKLYH